MVPLPTQRREHLVSGGLARLGRITHITYVITPDRFHPLLEFRPCRHVTLGAVGEPHRGDVAGVRRPRPEVGQRHRTLEGRPPGDHAEVQGRAADPELAGREPTCLGPEREPLVYEEAEGFRQLMQALVRERTGQVEESMLAVKWTLSFVTWLVSLKESNEGN